jgi:hypothetical protein
MRTRLSVLAAVVALVVAVPTPAKAATSLWRIEQLYSNATGDTQFVELETTSAGRTGQTSVEGLTLVSGGNTFVFTNNLVPSGSGTTQWLLLATSNLASLPGGVAPDFVIPENFFSPSGGTIVYASGVDSWTYSAVPTDGVHDLTRDPNTAAVTTTVNQPINFSGVAGQIGLVVSTPALPAWGVILAAGALLLVGSGYLRRRGRIGRSAET